MQRGTPQDIKEIRPYEGEEFRAALARVLESPLLPKIVRDLFPKLQLSEFRTLVLSLKDAREFQAAIIRPAIKSILNRSAGEVTLGGLENLPREGRFLFLSNHRDILCDPALFCFLMHEAGRETPLICLGDNLLFNQWMSDIVKCNKGLTVKRNLSPGELLRWSIVLSSAIREEIVHGKDSVWIAQREGRAKDGRDETHPGVLKMLALTGHEDFCENLAVLRPVPVSVSYEFDPCDALKAREVYFTEVQGSYTKTPGEDAESMRQGILGQKGRVHIQIGPELTDVIRDAKKLPNRREQLAVIVKAFDDQIRKGFRLFPSHHIAHALLRGETSGNFTQNERIVFEARMHHEIAQLKVDPTLLPEIRKRLLEAYARPIQ